MDGWNLFSLIQLFINSVVVYLHALSYRHTHFLPPPSTVELEVEVSATPQARIALGQSVSLFCNVTRASPAVGLIYVWRIDGGPSLAEETDTLVVSNIMANQFGTYSCEVTNDVGSDTGIITIEEEGVALHDKGFISGSHTVLSG